MTDDHKTVGARKRRTANKTNSDNLQSEIENDVHTTSKASRRDGHTTEKSNRKDKATRANDLRPFETKVGRDMRQHLSDRTQAVAKKSEWPTEFELDGVKYHNDGVLSDSSGEAIIFTVSRNKKKYALKLYYYDPEHRPNHKILEKIHQLNGSGLLVNIISHGEWFNSVRNEKNDYELMDFCEGDSLDGVVFDGDEQALAQVAVKMASAIDFLSKHDILHRDIKPGNFFYADKEKTQLVLADFGISVECPNGGTCKIDEMRSPVYAAPEFYTNVPGEPAEVGVESDYFSLGVSLLCLWMGKAKLIANESQLLRSKLNETLPMPQNLSPHMISLIKALTRLKISERATFDDIKRWIKGESLDTSDVQTINTDFRVVFNSEKNQVANSPSELAKLLLEDKVLGKKYLYSGRVTRWLEETGRNEIAVNVEEIVEKIYPVNQEAGLMAVAYMLDPSMDYVDPLGKHHTSPKEISKEIFYENVKMAQEVLRPDSNLMIYLHALKMDKTIASLREYIESDQFDTGSQRMNEFIACYYFAILLNPEMEFPVFNDIPDDSGDSKNYWTNVQTVEELLAAYNKKSDLHAINYYLVRSKALIVWLAYRDPALAGKIRMLHDNATDDVTSIYYDSDSAYRIIYELNPETDFWFNTDADSIDRCFTIEQIGEYLNTKLNDMVLGNAETDDFFDVFAMEQKDNRVGNYLRAKGENYAQFIEWNRFCMNDEDDEENSQKAGPYDFIIGAYKTVAGFLGHAPSYPIGGKLITSPEELEKLPKETVAREFGEKVRFLNSKGKKVPWLDAWLTLFFQENPKLDLSPQFTYEKETAKYVELIEKYSPQNYYAKRYATAIQQIDKAASKLNKSEKSVKGIRNFFILMGTVPMLILFLGTLIFGTPDVNPIKGHYWMTTIICSIGLIVQLSTLFWGFWNALIPGAIGGAITAGILYAGFRWFPSVLYFFVGLLLIVSLLVALYYLFKKEKVDTGGKTIRGNEFEYRQLDALYYAYHQENDNIDNVVTKYSEMQQSYNRTNKENLRYVGWIWLPMVWTFAVLWYFITPQLSGSNSWTSMNQELKAKSGQWVLGTWVAKYASGSTRIVCNIDSVANGKEIYGTMEIAGQNPVKAKGRVYSNNDTLPKMFSFYPEDRGMDVDRKQTLDAEYDEYDKKMEGRYTDRKGIKNSIVFVSTPLKDNSENTEPKSSAKPKSTKKNSKAGETPATTKPVEKAQENATEQGNDDDNASAGGLWKDTM